MRMSCPPFRLFLFHHSQSALPQMSRRKCFGHRNLKYKFAEFGICLSRSIPQECDTYPGSWRGVTYDTQWHVQWSRSATTMCCSRIFFNKTNISDKGFSGSTMILERPSTKKSQFFSSGQQQPQIKWREKFVTNHVSKQSK